VRTLSEVVADIEVKESKEWAGVVNDAFQRGATIIIGASNLRLQDSGGKTRKSDIEWWRQRQRYQQEPGARYTRGSGRRASQGQPNWEEEESPPANVRSGWWKVKSERDSLEVLAIITIGKA
jgi:hypothetical protein